jgi:hypothetical protein
MASNRHSVGLLVAHTTGLVAITHFFDTLRAYTEGLARFLLGLAICLFDSLGLHVRDLERYDA